MWPCSLSRSSCGRCMKKFWVSLCGVRVVLFCTVALVWHWTLYWCLTLQGHAERSKVNDAPECSICHGFASDGRGAAVAIATSISMSAGADLSTAGISEDAHRSRSIRKGAFDMPPGRNVSGALTRDGQQLVREWGEQLMAVPCGLSRDPPGKHLAWPPASPAIFTNLTGGWRASRDWNQEHFLQEFSTWQMPLSTFLRDSWLELVGQRAEVVTHPTDVSLKEYLSVLNSSRRNVFLFVRDDSASNRQYHTRRRDRRRRFIDALQYGYSVPHGMTEAVRIFAMDGTATGHGMHRHKEGWLAQIAGRKVWWLAPPQPEDEGSAFRPAFPYKALSEEEGSWPCAWLLNEDLVPSKAPLIRCVQEPGEIVVLPTGWWHNTCSLDDFNIAIGGQGPS
mmetsp:Transcript_112431/g.251164  ORF Transcript_112431/g.251164 Transcript_112431/m.251164 type:complete len:393 (-) Transcript_112431:138-1316(-)